MADGSLYLPQDTKLKTRNSEAPTVDLSFQLLSFNIRPWSGKAQGLAALMPARVASQWVAASFSIADLVLELLEGGDCYS